MCMYSIHSFVFYFSLQLFVSVSVRMAERALPLTSVSVSRVTLASGVKPVCIGQARFIVVENFVY